MAATTGIVVFVLLRGLGANRIGNLDQLRQRYAERSGRNVDELDFYVAFGYWKLACILQGVYYRYLGGALGSRDPAELEPFVVQIDGAAARATECLETLP